MPVYIRYSTLLYSDRIRSLQRRWWSLGLVFRGLCSLTISSLLILLASYLLQLLSSSFLTLLTSSSSSLRISSLCEIFADFFSFVRLFDLIPSLNFPGPVCNLSLVEIPSILVSSQSLPGAFDFCFNSLVLSPILPCACAGIYRCAHTILWRFHPQPE